MGIKEILHELHSEACKFTWDEYIEWLSTYCDDVIIRYKIKTNRKMYGGKLIISGEQMPEQIRIRAEYDIYFQDEESKWIKLHDQVFKSSQTDFVLTDQKTMDKLREIVQHPLELEIEDPISKGQ